MLSLLLAYLIFELKQAMFGSIIMNTLTHRDPSRSEFPKFTKIVTTDWGQSEVSENGPNEFPIPKNLGIDTKIKSLACSEPKLQFHSLKSSLASYSPSTLFLTFRWVWDFWKWFQMISHGQKHGSRSQIQVSRRLRTKFTVSLLEVVHGLLPASHTHLPLPTNRRLLKLVPHDCRQHKT